MVLAVSAPCLWTRYPLPVGIWWVFLMSQDNVPLVLGLDRPGDTVWTPP